MGATQPIHAPGKVIIQKSCCDITFPSTYPPTQAPSNFDAYIPREVFESCMDTVNQIKSNMCNWVLMFVGIMAVGYAVMAFVNPIWMSLVGVGWVCAFAPCFYFAYVTVPETTKDLNAKHFNNVAVFEWIEKKGLQYVAFNLFLIPGFQNAV